MTERDLFLVFDTEANGFYEDGTFMWILCAKDMLTGQRWEWGGPEGLEPYREEIRALFRRAKILVCHNLIKHDLPQMYKLGIVSPKDWWDAKIVDTFTISTVLNPDRPRIPGTKGPHGLESYGVRAGRLKPKQEQWAEWEENMRTRCREDVEINEFAFKYLQEESKQDAWEWACAIDVEHKAAFIIAEQERVGWHFFKDKAQEHITYLDTEIAKIDEVVVPMMPEKEEFLTPIKKLYLKNGKYTKQVCDWYGVEADSALSDEPPIVMPEGITEDIAKTVGIFQRIKKTPPNPNSDLQMKDFLLTQGWLPDEYTPKGSPKLTESSLDSVTGEAGTLLARRKVLLARRNQLENAKNPELKGWMSMIREDGRISAICNPTGAVSGRATHKQIVNVPRTTSVFGREMREVFGVPEGRRQVGYDASGLELRCLAHYMNDPDYIHDVLHGDIHTTNMIAAGLEDRNDAKTFIYALIYGAGDLKIGRIVGGNSTTGKELRFKFYKAIPALDELLTRTKTVAKRGFLKGLDGRKLHVRSDHSSLNTQLQAAGATVMKYAYIMLDDWLAAEGFKHSARMMADIYAPLAPAAKVGDIHDEGQMDVAEEYASEVQGFSGSKEEAELWTPDERIWSAPELTDGTKEDGRWSRTYARPGELAVLAIRQAGDTLGFNCPLDGEYKVGSSWADTH